MVFLPLHRTASLDAWRNPSLRSETVPSWVIWALRAQVGVVYLFGGIAKLNPDWLLHAQPMRIWLYNNSDLLMVGPLLREAWVAYATSWAGAAFDLTIVGWLLWRRSRPVAYVVLVVFHVMTWLLFPIGMFPVDHDLRRDRVLPSRLAAPNGVKAEAASSCSDLRCSISCIRTFVGFSSLVGRVDAIRPCAGGHAHASLGISRERAMERGWL